MTIPQPLRVGVTIFLRKGQQSVWENGIFQNCFFLAMLLKRSPVVEMAFLVNGGDGDPSDASDFLAMAPVPVMSLAEAQQELDVIIELSAQLNPQWAAEFAARGGRIVGMRVANDYVIDIERMIFNLPQGMLVSGTPYDAIWTLPAFEKTCLHYYRSALRAPVTAMQHLWSPAVLEHAMARAAPATPFGYRPGRTRWRLAILEPNICSVKTAHLAMLLCDVAHRDDPLFIDYVRVYNGMSLKEKPQFVTFARSLDLVQQGICTFEPRFPIYEVMTVQADAIVAHSWENEQNYVYYEALYGGYPLIHNSQYLNGCGYHYPEFDCHEGGLALRQAFAEHDAGLEDYRRRAAKFLKTLDPQSPHNVEAYGAAISGLYDAR